MPWFTVYTKEVHTGKYMVEAEDVKEAIEKVLNDDFDDKYDDDFEYYHKPENGGWSVYAERAIDPLWVS